MYTKAAIIPARFVYIMPKQKKPLISVVIPCYNEESAIAKTIDWAKTGLKKLSKKYKGEIIVVDNNSTDNSAIIARKKKVIVISEKNLGYGRAYLTGLSKAKGMYIIIGDSDATYDFREIPKFVKKLEKGSDIVLGNRFTSHLSDHSMPWFNRHVGNPILTTMINLFYNCRISDTQTGFRAFTKKAYRKMGLHSTGMEFASEMIIKAIANRMVISQVNINYHRRIGTSKLSPISDAWRHVQSILMFSPTYAIIFPGIVATLTGLTGTILLLSGPLSVGKFFLDIHTMISSVILTTLGVNIILTGIFARLYTVNSLNVKGGFLTSLINKYINPEKLLLLGIITFIVSLVITGSITFYWIFNRFGPLDKAREFIAALGLFSFEGFSMLL